MKYTYDFLSIGEREYTGGLGVTNKQHQSRLFDSFIKRHPNFVHMIIRRPDNVLIKFYHPYKSDVI